MLDKILHAAAVADLRQYHLFNAMNDMQFNQLLECARLKKLSPDQILFQQGLDLTNIYYIISGTMKLYISTLKGNEKIIEVIQTGRSFGEGMLFQGVPKYPVSAIAMQASVLVAINAKQYLKILKSSNSLCVYMLGHLSKRLHWMLKELDKQTLHNASFRIIDYFLNQINAEEDSFYDLRLTIPKRDIASRLSIKPETFSRALKSLADKGLIRNEDNHVILNDVHKLRDLIELEEI